MVGGGRPKPAFPRVSSPGGGRCPVLGTEVNVGVPWGAVGGTLGDTQGPPGDAGGHGRGGGGTRGPPEYPGGLGLAREMGGHPGMPTQTPRVPGVPRDARTRHRAAPAPPRGRRSTRGRCSPRRALAPPSPPAPPGGGAACAV